MRGNSIKCITFYFLRKIHFVLTFGECTEKVTRPELARVANTGCCQILSSPASLSRLASTSPLVWRIHLGGILDSVVAHLFDILISTLSYLLLPWIFWCSVWTNKMSIRCLLMLLSCVWLRKSQCVSFTSSIIWIGFCHISIFLTIK